MVQLGQDQQANNLQPQPVCECEYHMKTRGSVCTVSISTIFPNPSSGLYLLLQMFLSEISDRKQATPRFRADSHCFVLIFFKFCFQLDFHLPDTLYRSRNNQDVKNICWSIFVTIPPLKFRTSAEFKRCILKNQYRLQ